MRVSWGLSLTVCLLLCSVHGKDESVKHGNPKQDGHYKDGEHDAKYDHEAVLGTENGEEEFAQLSPEETREKLGKIVKLMDTNSDGGVDMDELKNWILQSFAKLNLEDTKQKMTTDDKDKDGFVTWEEFLESTYGMSEEELKDFQDEDVENPDAKVAMAKSLVYDKKKFAAADENKDGKLSPEEATAFLHPYDFPRMADVETDRVVAEYDSSSDGVVSLEEYLSHASFSKTTEEEKLGEEENFKYNDANGDGTLDRDEIKAWVSPDLDRVASDEASHLMGETDKDKDGSVSLDEVAEQSELWVGSEATDYGDMLYDHDEL